MKRFILIIFSIIGISLFFNSDTFAVSDISVTYNSSVSQWSNVFPSCVDSCLDDYSYLSVKFNNPDFSVGSLRLYMRFDGSNNRNLIISTGSSSSVYSLSYNGSANNYLQFGQTIDFSQFGSVTFTLSDHFGQPCPDCPDCEDPEENSRFIQVVLDAFWKYHIAFAGVAAALIAIFLIYRVLKGLLR